jgi:hypothetical protein
MVDRLTDKEIECISTRSWLDTVTEWSSQFEKHISGKAAKDVQLLHKIASLIVMSEASTAHRLDVMNLTLLRILNVLEASLATKPDQAIDGNASRQAQDEGGGDR